MCNCKEYQEIETGSILSSFQATTNCSHCSEQQYSKAHRHLEMNLAGPVFCSPNTSYPLYSPRPLCSVYPILRGIGIAHRISHLLFYLPPPHSSTPISSAARYFSLNQPTASRSETCEATGHTPPNRRQEGLLLHLVGTRRQCRRG